jgi:hypothetical protein
MKNIIKAAALSLPLALAILPGGAFAASIGFTPGSGGTVGAGTDGTNLIPATILCGASASATLYATCVNQAIVNASGQLLVLATQSGSWSVSVTSTPLPTGAATAANQEVTAAGTSATSAQAVQGVNGGVPVNVSCSSGCSGSGGGGGAADTPLTLSTTPISVANNPSTGAVVANFMSTASGLTGYSSGGAELTGTPTAGSAISTSGFTGWNSINVECTGGGAAGINWFEIDTSGGGTVLKRQATFTGPTFSGTINAAGATILDIIADQFSSGTLACTAHATQNLANLNTANGPIIGNFSSHFTVSSATTTQVVTGVGGLSIVLTGFSAWTDGNASSAGSIQIVAGTGSNCATGLVNVGAPINFPAGDGVISNGTVGQQFTLPPGDNLCVETNANAVDGNLTIAIH